MKKFLVAFIAFTLILFSTFIVSAITSSDSITDGRLHLHKPISLAIDSSLLTKHTLLFLGYANCPDICTPRMFEIQKIYEEYSKLAKKDDLNVLFISLKHDESREIVESFAKTFNENFIGFTSSKKELSKLSRTLNAYFSRSLTNSEEIDHTEHLYLINKEKDGTLYINNIYMKTPYDKYMIVDDLLKDK